MAPTDDKPDPNGGPADERAGERGDDGIDSITAYRADGTPVYVGAYLDPDGGGFIAGDDVLGVATGEEFDTELWRKLVPHRTSLFG